MGFWFVMVFVFYIVYRAWDGIVQEGGGRLVWLFRQICQELKNKRI